MPFFKHNDRAMKYCKLKFVRDNRNKLELFRITYVAINWHSNKEFEFTANNDTDLI